MSQYVETASLSVAQTFAASVDAALGFPQRATLVIGRRRAIQPSWDGAGVPPFGWCVTYRRIRQRADTGDYGYLIDARVLGAGVVVPPTVERPTEYRDAYLVPPPQPERDIVGVERSAARGPR